MSRQLPNLGQRVRPNPNEAVVEIRRYFWGVSNIAQSEPLGLRLIRIVTDWWWIRPKVRHSTGTEAVAAEARRVAAHGWNKMDVTALLITAATNSRRTLSRVRVHSRRQLRIGGVRRL